jgi:hypothetical protein
MPWILRLAGSHFLAAMQLISPKLAIVTFDSRSLAAIESFRVDAY